MRMSAFGRTDKGKRRSNNEDDLALVDLTEGRALPDSSAEHLRVGETILTSSLVRLPQRRGTFGYDAQRYPSAARRLRPVRCKGLLEGRPVWSPVTGRHQPSGAGKATSGLKECQQVDVEVVFVRVREAVGCTRVDF